MIDQVRGAVGDRPWGLTLGALAQRRVTGQLWLTGPDGKKYCVAFLRGEVVAATSPLAADSVARIALTSHLVSSTDVPAIVREVGAAPNRDEIEIVSRIARLAPDQAAALRRRVLIQRTARTFAIEHGEYEFEDRITLPLAPDIAVDVAAAIFLGARMNLTEARLGSDLRQLGLRFQLRREASVDADRFGFAQAEVPIVAALRGETSLVELDARFREIEPRTAAAIVYALVAVDLCQGAGGIAPAVVTAATAAPPVVEPAFPRTSTSDFEAPRSRTVTLEPIHSAVQQPDAPRRATRTLPQRPELAKVKEMIANLKVKVDANVDHFALLGVSPEDPLDTIRSAFVRIVSLLHPEKLPVLPLAESREAQRAFSRVRAAFAVLADPARRATYSATLSHRNATPGSRTATMPPPSRTATTNPPPVAAKASAREVAEDAFRRGLVALKREDLAVAVAELTRAVENAPTDHNYPMYLAWATFCAAPESTKPDVAVDTRKVLQRAIFNSSRPEVARFYLGRVERMMGRDREAAHHFREVLELDPNHPEAAAELRILDQRLAASGVRRK